MANRIEILRNHIDEAVRSGQPGELWFVDRHMLSVSNFAAMIALKRGLDPEVATMIGLLHDIHTLLTDDPTDHAKHGSVKAGEMLSRLGIVTEAETDSIVTAIKNHSAKDEVHDAYSELAKDADVLSHYFFNVTLALPGHEAVRLERLMREFGMETK